MDTLFAPGHGRLEDRDNIFTAMRMGFALLVVYGHALMMVLPWPVAGLWPQTVDFVGQRALNAFFVFSGYMILASLVHSRSITGFAISRSFRIFPMLIAVTLLMVCAQGPIASGMSPAEYLSHSEVWRFTVLLITQIDATAPLPFDATPIEAARSANAPLWTIRYELIGYVALALLALAGMLKRGWTVPAGFAGLVAVSAAHAQFGYEGAAADTVQAGVRFGLGFVAGALIYQWRDRIGLSWASVAASIGVAILLSGTVLAQAADTIAVAMLGLRIGFVRAPASRVWRALRDVEDYSYGIYVIHWPVGLLIMHAALGMGISVGTTTLAALMAIITLALAIPLRHGLEKPFQRMGRDLAREQRRSQAEIAAQPRRAP